MSKYVLVEREKLDEWFYRGMPSSTDVLDICPVPDCGADMSYVDADHSGPDCPLSPDYVEPVMTDEERLDFIFFRWDGALKKMAEGPPREEE